MHDPQAERFNSELFLTTSQVAALLEIHPSTVKRWFDEEEIRVEHTEGGHRRIHLTDALALARARGVTTYLDPFEPYQPHVWSAVRRAEQGDFRRAVLLCMGWLARGRTHALGPFLETLALRPEISYAAFADHGVRAFMREVGDAWQEGRLRIGDEHMASQIVLETLLSLRERWLGGADAEIDPGPRPRAVVGAAEGETHHLGSLVVRILLERRGWDVTYLGPDVPLEEFAEIQRRRDASLVCVSFAPPSSEGSVRRAIRVLGRLYDPSAPYALGLGGSLSVAPEPGPGDAPFRTLAFFRTAGEAQEWLTRDVEPLAREMRPAGNGASP